MPSKIPDRPAHADLAWFLAQARPRKLRTIRRFAEEEIVLPNGPFAGRRFRCDRQPYTGLWLDEIDSGGWSRFVATGPTQSGKTVACFVIPLLYHLFEVGETVICGLPDMDMARDKWISPRTVRRWERCQRQNPLKPPEPRGRRSLRATQGRRNELYRFLVHAGPQIGVAPLHRLFPDFSRPELADFLRRFRRIWSRRHPKIVARLKWNRAGAVWAVDHVEAPRPAEGRNSFTFIMNVRDVATHYQLAWHPVPDASAETTCRVLESLFHKHGRPLVLKSDNGSGFIGEKTRQLLQASGILHLRSPARRPQYNGSCEAGGGSLKKITKHQALLSDRTGNWTDDDAERARQIHNRFHRPWGRNGPTPDEAWRLRHTVGEDERAALGASKARFEDELAQSGDTNQQSGDERRQPWLERTAISLALQQLRYLNITRRLITPPIKSRKAVNIR